MTASIIVNVGIFSRKKHLIYLLVFLTYEYLLFFKQLLMPKKAAEGSNNRVLMYVKSILIPVVVGSLVGRIMSSFIDYEVLKSPFLAPPRMAFPIVWTILYLLMWCSYAILEDKKLLDKKLNILYYVQLGVNALWSIFFFICKWRLFSFLWIILLDILVIWMAIIMYKKYKTAWLLQLPYILWIFFASYLTLAFYLLNG